MTDINLEGCVGRTFERDGERCRVYYVFDKTKEVDLLWEIVSEGWTVRTSFPQSMVRLWLAGAVEVEGEK